MNLSLESREWDVGTFSSHSPIAVHRYYKLVEGLQVKSNNFPPTIVKFLIHISGTFPLVSLNCLFEYSPCKAQTLRRNLTQMKMKMFH